MTPGLADGFTPDVSRPALRPSAVLGRDPRGGSTSAKEYSGAEDGVSGGAGVAGEAARTVLILFWGLKLKFIRLIPSQCEFNYF